MARSAVLSSAHQYEMMTPSWELGLRSALATGWIRGGGRGSFVAMMNLKRSWDAVSKKGEAVTLE